MITDWVILALRVLAPILLYTFLGIILYRLWQDLRAETPPALLRRLDEPKIVLPLSAKVSFGRDSDNTFALDSEFVSAHHAQITYRGNRWWLTDLGSRNGTSLNEKRLPLQSSAPLTYGDIVSLGDLAFRLEQGT